MSLRLQAEIAKLKSQGVTMNDLTPEEIEIFVASVNKCNSPFDGINADAVGMPIRVREGLYFWRLTVGATVWLEEYAARWFPPKERAKAYFWALVYAVHHARDKESFVNLTTEAEAYEAIKKDILSINATEAEITEAVDVALDIGIPLERKNERQRQADAESQENWDELLRCLETQSGISVDVWAWERSAGYASRAYGELWHFARACSGSSGNARRMRDQLDEAITNLARVEAGIIRRVKEGNNGKST